MDLHAFETKPIFTGIAMRDEVEELIEDWYDWQRSYSAKLGYERVSTACRGYEAGWRESADLADIADERARRLTCETIDACVSRLDLRARIAIQTEMRNRFAGARVWSLIRLQGSQAEEYARALALLAPMLVDCGLIERTCKPD